MAHKNIILENNKAWRITDGMNVVRLLKLIRKYLTLQYKAIANTVIREYNSRTHQKIWIMVYYGIRGNDMGSAATGFVKNNKKVTWKEFARMLAVLAVPIAMQNRLATTASMVDTIMIGSEGEIAVAAGGGGGCVHK